MSERYPIRETEQKWQKAWDKAGAFHVEADPKKKKYYVLEMLPYPSGRIHMGHVRNYTIGDIMARFRNAQGYNVLHPMGWDAFGLPAENAAMEQGVHPARWTKENIDIMRRQLQSIGFSYDWRREFATCDPDYYQHEQRLFIEFYKKGLAYQKESVVNWDPVEHTVLANEQVVDGKGWRSGVAVERRRLKQWFLKITDYVEDLLTNIKSLEGWPEKVRVMQENWIGKSYGAVMQFNIKGRQDAKGTLAVYSTRPDTLFGASFCAIAPDHPLAEELKKKNKELAAFIEECQKLGTSEEALETAEKKGFATGLFAEHPFVKSQELPIYVANFVLMDYGTGAIFGCPAHDARDLEFALKYKLPVRPVVIPADENPKTFKIGKEPYLGEGILANSDFLDGLGVEEAKKKVIERLEKAGQGRAQINHRLRDWGVSRQRYWGAPIPMIYCGKCGIVAIPEQDLPVTLPDDVDFKEPGNPLARHPTWKHTQCPTCGGKAERETDTFDTFFESSWYYARYCSPQSDQLVDRAAADYWLPIDQYIGGVEHAVMHLLYFRFFTMAMRDCGYMSISEPATRLMTQGMITHETYQDAAGKWLFPDEIFKDADGGLKTLKGKKPVTVGRTIKMSKSKKNIVDPEVIIQDYGADTVRLFMLSDSPPERDLPWTDTGIDGAWRYISRIWRFVQENLAVLKNADLRLTAQAGEKGQELRKLTHRTIHAVTADIEGHHFNKAIARLRELSNAFEAFKATSPADEAVLKESVRAYLLMINPVIPHVCEELWQQLGETGMICKAAWPVADPALLIQETVTIAVQINGKLRATFEMAKNAAQKEVEEAALSLPQIVKALEETPPRRVIVVPNRIVNVVL